MKSVYKYPLELTDIQSVNMPIDAQVLSVQVQHGNVCIWAMVDTAAQREERWFQIIGTGHPIPDDVNREYIGTFQMHGGNLVFHLFERVL